MKQLGRTKILYGTENTIKAYQRAIGDKNKQYYDYRVIDSFEDITFLKSEINDDTFFVMLNGRTRTVFYDLNVDNIQRYLNKNLDYTSYVVFYPHQSASLSINQGIMNMDDFVAVPIEQNLSRLKRARAKLRTILKLKKRKV